MTPETHSGQAVRTLRHGDEEFLRIENVDRMPPFLMTLASESDNWVFVASTGGMTAGRVDPDGALLPYETVDRLFDSHRQTGPITLLRFGRRVWEPFTGETVEPITRHLDKSVLGHQLVVEESHGDLGLTVRARWATCDAFGHVRTVTVRNHSDARLRFQVLDGIRNVLPFGAPLELHQTSSCLVDAYKRVDVDPDTGLTVVSLTARIVDRPEAAEALRANVIWSRGLEGALALEPETPLRFRRGESIEDQTLLTGRRAGHFVVATVELAPGEERTWSSVADVGRDHVQIARLRSFLRDETDPLARVEQQLHEAGTALRRLLASSDADQCVDDPVEAHHHRANVLFNVMRGGVFWRDHLVPRRELDAFVAKRNRAVHERRRTWIEALPDEIDAADLLTQARATGDADLERLVLECLPLSFGRRHGDPSRPWNRFEIRTRDRNGEPVLNHQGNWRDIFQNWEALAVSFPGFLPGMIAKFVNASTFDGFNPYRITRAGIDWEVEDPDDPWSFIGYWGDHQIIYLLKLVEALGRTDPSTLESMLPRPVYSTAAVPYRLRPYADIVRDPHHTIDYDEEAAARVAALEPAIGSDARLRLDDEGHVEHVTLYEKLVVPALSKLSNLVADGGIWMNTQRPEWNDANNALVGHGVSMVTLCYLRRYLDHLRPLFLHAERVELSRAVCVWLDEVRGVLERFRPALAEPLVDDRDRRAMLDALGDAFERYRRQVADHGIGERKMLSGGSVADLFRVALEHVDHAISANRRDDGLLHAYNVLVLDDDVARLERLPLMLEGQVAALSSGSVDDDDALHSIDALFTSELWRADQNSFLLYPATELPTFFARNAVDSARAETIGLVRAMLDAGDASVLARDADGTLRFHGDFTRADDVRAALDALDALDPRWHDEVTRDRQAVLDLFEATFHHHSFTGRSGTMYAYEGLGSIYWHMVAKLLLAVQEIALRRADERRFDPTFDALARAYYRVRDGLGFAKTPTGFGAFPTDPYSHTPPHAGAQQPGMTGQVKEEVLTRFGELGVRVEDGVVSFRPVLLRRSEFRGTAGVLETFDRQGNPSSVDVPAGALAFSWTQVPIVYRIADDRPWIDVQRADGTHARFDGDRLDATTSRTLLRRDGAIARVDVAVDPVRLLV